MPKVVDRYESWSRLPFPGHALAIAPSELSGRLDLDRSQSFLPFGRGRTYSDTCLNPGGGVIDTTPLDRVLAFDPEQGVLRAEAGVTWETLLERLVPEGWFLPVCPGTRQVSLGGAVAHDVHGKNQPTAGTLGCHIVALELLRSSGERLRCAPDENAELFRATIGGLGLTGLIVWVELRLARLPSTFFEVERLRCTELPELLTRARASGEYEYTMAWVDSLAGSRAATRSLVMRGRPDDSEAIAAGPRNGRATAGTAGQRRRLGLGRLGLGGLVPSGLFRRSTMRAFNLLYYYGPRGGAHTHLRQHYADFLFPQDTLHASNRLYGKRGVYAYQCLIPEPAVEEFVPQLLARTCRSGEQSLVTVVKPFGARESPGLLSFSGAGLSIAVGFPNEGRRTLAVLSALDELVGAAGGKLYPAKDARMPAAMFQSSFPRWEEFATHVDPCFSSSFWRRVSEA